MTDKRIQEKFIESLSECATKGVDYIELKKNTGISQQVFSNYLHGHHMPNVTSAVKLALYFNVSLDDLTGIKMTDYTTTAVTLGISKRILKAFADLPYEKKKVVVDMINVLSKKE
ncbi:MAG: helix-turn-helix transcriptional regulator [Acutalibacteraceae bacterium]|nr:helix-turn-helix transcriptional regulator [Acutalibacteraceae bacterium]